MAGRPLAAFTSGRSRNPILDTAGRAAARSHSNTDQQISLRKRWSSRTSSRIASGSCSRCHRHSSRPALSRLACGSRRTRGLDRVGRSTELVCGDMRHHRGLAGSECRVTGRSAQHSCRSHGMAGRRAGLGHRDLASRPCPNLFDRLAGPGVRGLHRLEEVQNVLCARGRPQSQEPMVGVRERAPAADGDEPGVAVLGQDHGSTVRRW